MKTESYRGKYWWCKECREFAPDEQGVCVCGHIRYKPTVKDPKTFVPWIPLGLRGDKMYVHRQNGKQLMDSMVASQKKVELQRVKERKARNALRPIVI